MSVHLSPEATSDVATPRCVICLWPLLGRKKRFCSPEHRFEWWNRMHPRINRSAAGPREGTLKAAILQFLRDNPGEHTEQQIADAIHGFSHSVGARISELRRANEPIEVRRGPQSIRLYRWGRA